jgi:hypothetical protein
MGLTSRVACAVLVVSGPVAAWWLVGPIPVHLDGAGPAPSVSQDPNYYDYMVRPPAIRPSVEWAAGLGATSALLLAAATVALSARRGLIDRRWWLPLGVLVALGCGLGIAERVVTAPVIGANFGGLFILMFGTPLAAVFGLGIVIRSVQILRTTSVG